MILVNPITHTDPMDRKIQMAGLCTRIKSMKGKLLRTLDLKSIEDYSSLSEFVDFLLSTDYSIHIKKSNQSILSLNDLELNIHAIFHSHLAKVLDLVKKYTPDYYFFFLQPWELYNAKTLIRHVYTHNDHALLESSLVYVGGCTPDIIDEMKNVEDLEQLYKVMDKWKIVFARTLFENLILVREEHGLYPLEHALDSACFAYLTKNLPNIKEQENRLVYSRLLTHRIDLENIKTALRFIHKTELPHEPEEFFIAGGKQISLIQFNKLLACDKIEIFLDLLQGHAIHPYFEEGILHFINAENPAVFDRFFQEYDLKIKRSLSITFPVSLATPVYYSALIENEIVNLRTLARGIHYQLPKGILHKELIYV